MKPRPYWEAPAGNGDNPAPAPKEVSFVVHFDTPAFYERDHNLDLSGRGTLRIDAEGRTFRFSGKERKLFFPKAKVMDFAPEEIADVATDVIARSKRVQFTTAKGRCGEKQQPFVFYAKNHAEAEEIARHLPATETPGGARSFSEKLRHLSGATHPLASATACLVLANIALFVVAGLNYGADFWQGATMTPFIEFWASNGAATTGDEWWRLLTSMFMHYGVLHLLMNMWALAKAGELLERLMGRSIYLVTYLVSGLGGGLASIYWYGDKVWSAGASGAIFGVYGATLGVLLRLHGEFKMRVLRPLLNSTLLFVAYNLMQGMQHTGIDNADHVGGMLTGFVLGLVTALPLDLADRAKKHRSRLAAGLAASVAIVGLGVAITPRFDYRPGEEIAFDKTAKPILEEIKTRAVEFKAAADRLDRSRGKDVIRQQGEAFRQQADNFIAYCQRSETTLQALVVTPGLRTDQRRKKLLAALDTEISNGRLAEKVAEEQVAFNQLSVEFDTALSHLTAHLIEAEKGKDQGRQLGDLAGQLVRPFFAEWEGKFRELTLTNKDLLTAREKALALLQDKRTKILAVIEEKIKQLNKAAAWQNLQTDFQAGYQEITRHFVAKQQDPAAALAIIEGEFLPYLSEWEKKVTAAGAPSPELMREQLKLIRNAQDALGKARQKIADTVARNQIADELNRRIKDLNSLSQRFGAVLTTNKTWSTMLPPLRDDILPAFESLQREVNAMSAPDTATADARRKLLDEVGKKRTMARHILDFAELADRIETEQAALSHRLAENAKSHPADAVGRLYLSTEVIPAYDNWLKQIDALALPEPALAAEQEKMKTKLRQQKTAMQAMLTQPAK